MRKTFKKLVATTLTLAVAISTFVFSGITAKTGTLPEAVKLSNYKELDDKINSIDVLKPTFNGNVGTISFTIPEDGYVRVRGVSKNGITGKWSNIIKIKIKKFMIFPWKTNVFYYANSCLGK